MVKFIKSHLFLILFLVIGLIFYHKIYLFGKIPVPADTIIGLYHPYRDFYAKEYPRGLPFKNFLITDPIRQTYIWKEYAITSLKNMELPLWNPYEMSGKPQLANFQTGVFYPFNMLLFIKPFFAGWTLFIVLQTFLAGFFTYLYLKGQKLNAISSLFGSVAFSFSGFFVAWLEWGNVVHTAMWLPLILYFIDRLVEKEKSKNTIPKILLLALTFSLSFFAGHLQTFFYIMTFSVLYAVLAGYRSRAFLVKFFLSVGVFFVISIPQSLPTLRYILLSARSIDQDYKTVEGWFVPFRHLIQYVAPDFFGNPATLNYWGVWNYAEMIGYVGIIPLIFAIFSLSQNPRKKIFLFAGLFIAAILLSTESVIAYIPFQLGIPFVSQAQPTRILFLACFALSVLAGFGFNGLSNFLKDKSTQIKLLLASVIPLIIIIFLWGLVLTNNSIFFGSDANMLVAKRNLILPTGLVLSTIFFIFITFIFRKKNMVFFVSIIFLFLTVFDLLRVSFKFETFTNSQYLYPETKALEFLKAQSGIFRIATLDRRILPPNLATVYKLQSIEGYDPLYLKNYGQYIASLERGRVDFSEPFGFNRILTPHNYNSPLFDRLNVKYILSLEAIDSKKLRLVFQEGETRVYENLSVKNRFYCASQVLYADTDNKILEKVFSQQNSDVVWAKDFTRYRLQNTYPRGSVRLLSYTNNKVIFSTDNANECFLVLNDVYYPTWSVEIDGEKRNIIKTNFAFRGVLVPSGKHTITFYDKLF